uniref:CRAL-TRIO domain-containing protein n=1 Tax=Angiostrongylus cantonensis TaxID=6313 RepID=A0A0K0D5Z0_ANGCA
MTRGFSTAFGEPLTDLSKRIVNDVRLRITQPISEIFDTDFNIYRFVMAAERLHKKEKDIIEASTRSLNNHLRIRKALDLDNEPVKSFDENPIFQKKLMPKGEILTAHDRQNRLLWYIEYSTISVESIAHALQTSQACKYQFWQFEYMLRRVMEQEEKTGRLSSIRHIVDMSGYEINPFTMIFVSSGTLAYYSQLFHYDNYPELVTPVDIVNIAKWIYVPYNVARTMMPTGFSDKFRLHDGNFLKALAEEIDVNYIPTSLGGKNKDISCIGAVRVPQCEYWVSDSPELLNQLESFHIPARKSRHMTIEITETKTLSWYFRTDGDV